MKGVLSLMGMACLLVSCDDNSTLNTSETRELAALDLTPVNTEATSKERFEMPSSTATAAGVEHSSAPTESGLLFQTPAGWTEIPGSMFRSVNMSLPDGGEAYVSQVGGNILDNVNRWYKQFQLEGVTQTDLDNGEKIALLGQAGYLIRASGTYNSGMGRPSLENATLLGAVAQTPNGLVTVKLIANKEEAAGQEENFRIFCRSLARK